MNISGLWKYLHKCILPNLFWFSLSIYFNWLFRSSDCFSLGWPMRDDGEFFKSARESQSIVQVRCIVFERLLLHFQSLKWNDIFAIINLQGGKRSQKVSSKSLGKSNFVETRTFWHIFRSFDRVWTFYALALQVLVSSIHIYLSLIHIWRCRRRG